MGTRLVPQSLVLDSWPLLEWIKGREPARTQFISLATDAKAGRTEFHMSRLNLGEAIYSVHKAPEITDAKDALARLRSAPITVHTVDDALVDAAVVLKSKYSFSYADAFAAALAVRLHSPLVTGDREFRRLEEDGLVSVFWLGS